MATHVHIDVDPRVVEQVCRDLEIEPPMIRVSFAGDARMKRQAKRTGRISELRGLAHQGSDYIEIVNTHASIQQGSLTVATRQVAFTLLHELRHIWQDHHWDEATKKAAKVGPYELRMEEKDANEYAQANLSKYPGLVRLHRQGTRTTRRLP